MAIDFPGLRRDGSSSQVINQGQDFLEQLPWNGDLGQLECDITTMANDLGSDLDQLPPQRGQRPMLHFLGQRQGPHEVGEVVGQGVKLEANLVVAELAARQPRPFDGLLAFLDELLRRATVIVKRHNPVGLAL